MHPYLVRRKIYDLDPDSCSSKESFSWYSSRPFWCTIGAYRQQRQHLHSKPKQAHKGSSSPLLCYSVHKVICKGERSLTPLSLYLKKGNVEQICFIGIQRAHTLHNNSNRKHNWHGRVFFTFFPTQSRIIVESKKCGAVRTWSIGLSIWYRWKLRSYPWLALILWNSNAWWVSDIH